MMTNMSTKKSKKPKAVVGEVKPATKRPRRRAPAKLKWPAQLKLMTDTTNSVLQQCDAAQAQEVADYLLKIGMGVIAHATKRPLMLLVQDSTMERLLVAIATYAGHNNTSVDAVAATLIAKLGPDAVEEGKLN